MVPNGTAIMMQEPELGRPSGFSRELGGQYRSGLILFTCFVLFNLFVSEFLEPSSYYCSSCLKPLCLPPRTSSLIGTNGPGEFSIIWSLFFKQLYFSFFDHGGRIFSQTREALSANPVRPLSNECIWVTAQTRDEAGYLPNQQGTAAPTHQGGCH